MQLSEELGVDKGFMYKIVKELLYFSLITNLDEKKRNRIFVVTNN